MHLALLGFGPLVFLISIQSMLHLVDVNCLFDILIQETLGTIAMQQFYMIIESHCRISFSSRQAFVIAFSFAYKYWYIAVPLYSKTSFRYNAYLSERSINTFSDWRVILSGSCCMITVHRSFMYRLEIKIHVSFSEVYMYL